MELFTCSMREEHYEDARLLLILARALPEISGLTRLFDLLLSDCC